VNVSTAAQYTRRTTVAGHADGAITGEDPDAVKAAVNSSRAHRGVDFADSLILEVARKTGQ
jgi:hypothetical protein